MKISLIALIQGYTSLVWSLVTGRITWQAYYRSKICYDCSRRKGKYCKACMCYIPAKVRAKRSVCPKSYWANGLSDADRNRGGGVVRRGVCD